MTPSWMQGDKLPLRRFMFWVAVGALLVALVLPPLAKRSGAHTEDLAAIERGLASWYSVEACQYNPDPACPTASGLSLYDLEAGGISFGASWNYPLKSWVKVCNANTYVCTPVFIADRGPAKRLVKSGRIIDLSKLAFMAINDGELEIGLIWVEVFELTTPSN